MEHTPPDNRQLLQAVWDAENTYKELQKELSRRLKEQYPYLSVGLFSAAKFVGDIPERKDIPVDKLWRVELEISMSSNWDEMAVRRNISDALNSGEWFERTDILSVKEVLGSPKKMNINEEITNDFVEAFAHEETWDGAFCHIVAMWPDVFLPLGVDPTDPRVQEVIRKCQEAKNK